MRVREWLRDPRRAATAHRKITRDREAFRASQSQSRFAEDFAHGPDILVLGEWAQAAATIDSTYFLQDLYVARQVFKRQPDRHIDVGSSLAGLVANIATFTRVEVIDIRPAPITIPGVKFLQHDVLELDASQIAPSDSVSSLHALEHVGLGRYGDPIDADGWFHALVRLRDIVTPGGILYVSVPIGRVQRIHFNAHRVFSLPFLCRIFEDLFSIEDFAVIDDQGALHTEIDLSSPQASLTFDLDYGCGIFSLRVSQ